jgi:hypothetical protein
MSHDQHDLKVTYLRNLNFKVNFVVFRLMKNIIFNKTESFAGRNTSDHACQIFCSKSNCETMYHWFFLLEITMVKKWTIWMLAPPTAIYTHGPGLSSYLYYVILMLISLDMDFILITSVVSNHLSYVTLYQCCLGKSHNRGSTTLC